MYRGWTEIDRQDRHWNADQKEGGTLDDRRRDGGTNSTSRIKVEGMHLTLNVYDDDDDDDIWRQYSRWFCVQRSRDYSGLGTKHYLHNLR